MTFPRIRKYLLSGIAILALVGYFGAAALKASKAEHQHDFISYYYGVKAADAGLNPYVSQSLSRVSGKQLQAHLRYVYLPFTLWVFKPLTLLPFEQARWIFLALKLCGIAALIALWGFFFLPGENTFFLLAVLAIGAFHETIAADIFAGNISTFEELLIWTAMAFYLKQKPGFFAFFIVLASLFKVTPILFLLLLLFPRDRKSIGWMVAGFGAFAAIHVAAYWAQPEWYRQFWLTSNPLDSSGFRNPSSLAFLTFGLSLKKAGVFYGAWVGLLGLYGLRMLLAKNLHETTVIVGGMLLYALALPRFKDYSFILLIVPALIVISVLPGRFFKFLMTALLLVSLWPYHHLFMAALLLFFFHIYIFTPNRGLASENQEILELEES